EEYVFVDIGSGKGKLLLLAAKLHFSEIIGIEYAPALHEIAVQNIDRFKQSTGCPIKISSVNEDALKWPLPERPAIFFMYNPFDLETTKAFFARLDEHATRSGMPIAVIYGNLRGVNERQEAFRAAKSLIPKIQHERFVIFVSEPRRP